MARPLDSVRRAKAEQWFNDSNKNVSNAQNDAFPGKNPSGRWVQYCTEFLLDDPPFYLNRPSNIPYACPMLSDPPALENRHERTLATRPVLSRMEPSENTSEEFRGVIDDLTVKNKKLRQKLKKYENLHSLHLQEEKLFEVRIHGLPPHKKRELDQTLRSFASSLDDSSSMPTFLRAPPQASLLSDTLPLTKPMSSPTSYSKPIDSAYASISASGQTMYSQSARNEKSIERSIPLADSKRPKLKSRTPHVSQQLLPTKLPFITEKAKRKVIVRKLEQLFTGKGAATKGYNWAVQQQEISHIAARADKKAGEGGGSPLEGDGMREARILPPDSEFPEDPPGDGHLPGPCRDSNDVEDLKCRDPNTTTGGEDTSKQRPTRLLDLHTSRAQVPAENMQYIRHLRLASPTMSSEGPPDNDWIYLNLLASMAQLHTLNVTQEFVRKAVAEVSTKFELSSDGRKLRWRGGAEGTRMSSDSDSSARYGRSSSSNLDHYPRKKRRTGESRFSTKAVGGWGVSPVSNSISTTQSGAEDIALPLPLTNENLQNATNFQYKPLFFRGPKPKSDDESNVHDDDHSVSSTDPGDDTSTLLFRRKGSGPIIYYKDARFCTDLSGDPNNSPTEKITYTRFTEEPLGRDMVAASRHFGIEGKRGPLSEGQAQSDSVKVGSGTCSTTGSPLTVKPYEPLNGDTSPENLAPIYLEASGLGGVQPQDNFVINVHVQCGGKSTSVFSNSYRRVHRALHKFPVRKGIFGKINFPSAKPISSSFAAKTVSVRTTMLNPSTLPDPSYLCLPFSENDEDDEDEHDNNLRHRPTSKNEDDALPKSMSISSWQNEVNDKRPGFHFTRSDAESDGTPVDTASERSDDSSIDLLAHARVLDPDTIAAREREFDSSVGQPLAEVQAGSSAATAGGGSGFDSETSGSSESS